MTKEHDCFKNLELVDTESYGDEIFEDYKCVICGKKFTEVFVWNRTIDSETDKVVRKDEN